MLLVNMVMLHVDMKKLHMDITVLHVDKIFLACRGQKYVTIQLPILLNYCLNIVYFVHIREHMMLKKL